MIGIDCEYVAENAQQGEHPGKRPNPENTYCELIQIGACKLDDDGKEQAALNLTIRAQRIKELPSWLSKMTGMTKERRERNGTPFPEALDILEELIKGEVVWTFNKDWWVITANMKAQGIKESSILHKPFQRLKPKLSSYGLNKKDFQNQGFKEICSGGLHKVLDIELPKTEGIGVHDAAHDARSLIYSVYKLEKMFGARSRT